MQLPQSAGAFIAFMEDVWRADCSPSTDGGVIMTGSPLYDDYHDARRVAKLAGAIKRYGAGAKSFAYHWDMPDGSRVAIGTDGNSIREVQKHLN